jgi:hypothetical protein
LYVNAQLSAFVAIVNAEERVELQPGETHSFSWEVGKENIDLQSFIFARVFTSASTTSGMREATCGTFVLNLPIKGGPVIFYASLVIAIIAWTIGLWLWPHHSDMGDPAIVTQISWMRFVSLVIAVGVGASIFGLWFLGIVTILLTMLLLSLYLLPRKA